MWLHQGFIDPRANPTFTDTVNGITKTMISLANVDNASDLNNPVSTATQAALNLKATATDIKKAFVEFGNVYSAIDLNQPERTEPAAANDLNATTTHITETLIGFGNVGNESD